MRPLKTLPFALLLALPLIGAACGGDDGNADGTNDSNDSNDVVVIPDARPDGAGSVDAPPSGNCPIPNSLGTVTEANAVSGADASPPADGLGYFTDLTPPVQLSIQLFSGFGVFETAAIGPGTYQLTGAETNYADCGACVGAYLTADDQVPNYLATAGTLNITSVSGNFTGTLSGVTLAHVDIDEDLATTPNADGCTTSLTSLSFNTAIQIEQPPADAAPLARFGKPTKLLVSLSPESSARVRAALHR